MRSFLNTISIQCRHPERSGRAAFAQSKDPATFTPTMIQGGQDPRRQWPVRRPALEGSATLMPDASKIPPRSFDSARPTANEKARPPLASLRMTEPGNDTFPLVPKLHFGTQLSAQLRCFIRLVSPIFRLFFPILKGLESYSPGLAHQRLPWVHFQAETNPERVEATQPSAS